MKIQFLGDNNNNFLFLANQLAQYGIRSELFSDLSRAAHELYRPWDWFWMESHLGQNHSSFALRDFAIEDFMKGAKEAQLCVGHLGIGVEGATTVASGIGPSLLASAGIRPDVVYATGADCRRIPFESARNPLVDGFVLRAVGVSRREILRGLKRGDLRETLNKWLWLMRLPKRQQQAISESLVALQGEYYLETWPTSTRPESTGLDIAKGLHLSDAQIDSLEREFPLSSHFRSVRSRNRLMIVSTVRSTRAKGVHILANGFCDFVRENQAQDVVLVLSRRGEPDGLIDERNRALWMRLRTEGRVQLMPLISMRHVPVVNRYADLCFGGITGDLYAGNSTQHTLLAQGYQMISYVPAAAQRSGYTDFPHEDARSSACVSTLLEIASKEKRRENWESLRWKEIRERLVWWNQFQRRSLEDWLNVLL